MQQNELIKAFQKAKYEPDPILAFQIWQKISLKNKRIAQFKFTTFSLIGVLSFLGILPAFTSLVTNLVKSGFYEYFSLLFSDGGSILSYWKELMFSLAESLPTTSIIITLSLVCICFFSLKYIVRQIYRGQLVLRGATLSVF